MPNLHLTEVVVQRLRDVGIYYDDATPAFRIKQRSQSNASVRKPPESGVPAVIVQISRRKIEDVPQYVFDRILEGTCRNVLNEFDVGLGPATSAELGRADALSRGSA
jgi:hypothetical protein